MDGDIGFGYTHRQKRTHSDMENEGSPSPTWSSLHHLSVARERSNGSPSRPHVSGLRLPQLPLMQPSLPPSQPPRRYHGDGLDFRRPISLSRNDSRAAVIDLTADDAGPSASSNRPTIPVARAPRPPNRLPRFAREIIDVDDEDVQRLAAPNSPEIEFISSRRIDPPRGPPAHQNSHAEEDDLEILGSNALPRGNQMLSMGAMMAMADALRDDPHRQVANLRRHIQRAANMPVPLPRRGLGSGRGPGHIHVGFIAPIVDFEMVGFDMGLEGGGPPPPPPPPPTYDAPGPAPDGFMRSPNETDPLICPNCEDELCVGETERKKQVWIVKGCGHVYCGECTANRSVKRSAKGKEKIAPIKHKPFKECAVDGCSKKTSNPKAMIQVFL